MEDVPIKFEHAGKKYEGHFRHVSGAGDTVIATLTMMLACGADIQEAALIANYAGGIVCSEVGIVPIEPAALRSTILK